MERTGRIESAIVETLRSRGQWAWANDIAADVFRRARPDDSSVMPHAFWVSMRRAINRLSEKGVIGSGYAQFWLHADRRKRLACWLPEHDAPWHPEAPDDPRPVSAMMTRFDAEEIRSAILEVLGEVDEAMSASSLLGVHRSIRGVAEPLDISYGTLLAEVRRKLGIRDYHESKRLVVSFSRAIKRLAEDQKISVLRTKSDSAKQWRSALVGLATVAVKDLEEGLEGVAVKDQAVSSQR